MNIIYQRMLIYKNISLKKTKRLAERRVEKTASLDDPKVER